MRQPAPAHNAHDCVSQIDVSRDTSRCPLCPGRGSRYGGTDAHDFLRCGYCGTEWEAPAAVHETSHPS